MRFQEKPSLLSSCCQLDDIWPRRPGLRDEQGQVVYAGLPTDLQATAEVKHRLWGV
jgi:hypothetical protein